MEDRDEKILRHIGRYRVSIRAVIEQLFFSGESCDHVLQRLSKDGRVQTHRAAIPGGLSYYQLSLTEARRLGFPDSRARQDKTKLLRRELAVLWFCCMTPNRRKRLEREEYRYLGSGKGLASPHVAELAADRSTIYRVYLPGPEIRDERFVDVLRDDAFLTIQHPQLSEWADRGTYQIALVVENQDRADKLQRMIEQRTFPRVGIHCEVVPPFELLYRAVRQS